MVRFINFLGFIQNMDVWIVFIWIFSVFVKMSVYLFIKCHGTAQLFGCKKWRRFIIVAAFVIFVLSILPSNKLGIMDYTKLCSDQIRISLFHRNVPGYLSAYRAHSRQSAGPIVTRASERGLIIVDFVLQEEIILLSGEDNNMIAAHCN
jgi:hypothetical protein